MTFHSNLSFNKSYSRRFPCFYKNILVNWKQYLTTNLETISDILSQNLWFNKNIIIDSFIVNFTKLSQKSISFVDQLVNESFQFKKSLTLKDEYRLENDMYFQWVQLIHVIPQTWKNKIKQNLKEKNESKLLVLNHYLIRNARILIVDKLTAKEIYSVLILSLRNKSFSQNYFESSFPNNTFDWKQICLLPRIKMFLIWYSINWTICNIRPTFFHKFLFNELMMSYTLRVILDHLLQQWLIGRRGEKKNIMNNFRAKKAF